jgi:acyl carrier protein
MNKCAAWASFKPVVATFLDLDVLEVRPYSFWRDLGVDSLDYVELIMHIEEEFDVEFTEQELDDNRTVGGLYKLLIRTLQANREAPITHRDTVNTRCSLCGR